MINMHPSFFQNSFAIFALLSFFTLSSCSSITIRPLSNKSKEKKERKRGQYASNKTYTPKKRTPIHRPKSIAKNSLRSQIVQHALGHIGTKYVYGGKNPKGFDCSGFTAFVMKEGGIPLNGSSRDQAKMGKRKAKKDLVPGDLAFFGSKGKVSHVGIVKENTGSQLIVVHSTSSKGVRTDDINGSSYWRNRFLFGRDVID